jgi:hypothetical protein
MTYVSNCNDFSEIAPNRPEARYDKGMKNETAMTDLSSLSNDALEALFEAYSADDCSDEQWDGLMVEMLRRDDFVASTRELEYTLECWA